MNDLGVQTREKLRMNDRLNKTKPKKKYCCTKLQFVAEKLQQKICPFCNRGL